MKQINKQLYWTPRILAIAFTCFIALFSFDVFGNGLGFWDTVVAFLIHNIITFILIAVIIISWKYEIVGGVVFSLLGLAYIAWVIIEGFQIYMSLWILQISGPAILTGVLFIIGWLKKKSL